MNNDIKIGFSASNSFIARFIRKISKSEVSHTFVSFYDEDLGMQVVMEASWSGYRIIPYNKFLEITTPIYEFIYNKDLSENLKWSAKSLTKSYDWLSAMWLLIKKWVGKKIKNPFRDSKKWHCTEAIIRMLQYSGIAMELKAEDAWPKDLLEYCKSNNNFALIYHQPRLKPWTSVRKKINEKNSISNR